MANTTVYVFSGDNCKFEGMTKEQVIEAITNATKGKAITDVDTGFVTKIQEINKNAALKFWVGSTSEYNAIEQKENNCLYILSDETDKDDIEGAIDNLNLRIDGVNSEIANFKPQKIPFNLTFPEDIYNNHSVFLTRLTTKSFPKYTTEILLNKAWQGDDNNAYLTGSTSCYLSMYDTARILDISITFGLTVRATGTYIPTTFEIIEITKDLQGAIIGTQTYSVNWNEIVAAGENDYIKAFNALIKETL